MTELRLLGWLQSMGIMGQYDNPRFIEAVDYVIDTAKAKEKYSGIQMMAVPALQPWIEKGMTLNLWPMMW